MTPTPDLLRRLLRAKDRMDAASHEAWPVDRLAEVSGVSQAHFARSFKQAFGVPPHRYLLTRRIERATALLMMAQLDLRSHNNEGAKRYLREAKALEPGEQVREQISMIVKQARLRL